MNRFRRMETQIINVFFISLITSCSSVPSTPIISPTLPLFSATSVPTVIPTQEKTQFTVSASCSKVRKFPNTSSTVILYLEEGQLVTAQCGLGTDGNWCQVEINNGTQQGMGCIPTKEPAVGPSKLIPLGIIPTKTNDKTGWVWGGCLGMGSDCK
jgi:hypothetical protein